MKNKISVILPTYNEAENICTIIEIISKELDKKNYEIIVVDDNSPDGTSELVAKLKNIYPNLVLITRKSDRGLVNSINDGISHATGNICIWMDADLSMSPKMINEIIEKIDNGADLVVGSRYIEGGGIKGSDHRGHNTPMYTLWKNLTTSEDSLISTIISKIGNKIIKLILQIDLHDYSSGYFGARKDILKILGVEGGIVDYCISLPYRAFMKGYKIVEIPMLLDTRKFGKSKTSNNFYGILKIALQCYTKTIQLKLTIKNERKKQTKDQYE
jgi:dolichol-phosphate mannosyltransferase